MEDAVVIVAISTVSKEVLTGQRYLEARATCLDQDCKDTHHSTVQLQVKVSH